MKGKGKARGKGKSQAVAIIDAMPTVETPDVHPGQPTKYRPEYAQKALVLCNNGATIRDVAEFFRVTERTVYNWSHEYPEFFQALKVGRDAANNRVIQSLYRRATGYSFDSVKIMQYEGSPIEVPYVEHVAPDVTACIFWLKNRMPDEWRDVKAVEHAGTVAHKHTKEMSDDELERIASGSSDRVAIPAKRAKNDPGVH